MDVALLPDARELAARLVGKTIPTLDQKRPNEVLRLSGRRVIVGTEKSPGGEPVELRKVQEALDMLYSAGKLRIAPETFGGYRRSSAIGAMLGTLEGITVTPPPIWLKLAGGESTQDGGPDVAVPRGYPDPALGAAVDEAGTSAALRAIARRFAGLEIVQMPHNNPGFDVKVLDEDGVLVAYVEIKSTLGSLPAFFLSENERRFAKRHADRYHLVVVTSVDLATRSGEVHWRSGALAGAEICLEPRQWAGMLL